MPPPSAFEGGIEVGEDDFKKADRLAARAARFSNKLPGNRFKELEESRTKERKAFEAQGLIKVGKTELGDAVDMKGTCEQMCSDYEREFREYTREIHPFEAAPNKRMDPAKAVAAYSRSDAGAGHGESAILPSDLRTPQTLVRTLDYLFAKVMSTQSPELIGAPTARKALGYTAGFIRDRTRAIRKEFAMQSSWGHEEAIASFERIARWHILCLRELQEETGMNSDMHIDSAELGRCFTSLRQHYNDRREELGTDLPCSNEPEFQAYMLIFNLADKSVAIPTSELPSVILDHPLVKIAWEIRRTAQRNFDTQKEGSKSNAEYGANMINLFVRLLQQPKFPYLLSCLVEVRLREMRRSALRALTRTYPRLRSDPLRYNDQGEVVERRMVLIQTLDKILGCEEQEDEETAYDDIEPVSRSSDEEAVNVVTKFELDVFPDVKQAIGALINLGSTFNDNRDAPFTRRWKLITSKREGIAFVDVVNGKAGIHIDGTSAPAPQPARRPTLPMSTPLNAAAPAFPPKAAVAETIKAAPPSAFSFNPTPAAPVAQSSIKRPKEDVAVPTNASSPFSFFSKAANTSTIEGKSPRPAAPAQTAPAFSFSTPAPTPPTLRTQPPQAGTTLMTTEPSQLLIPPPAASTSTLAPQPSSRGSFSIQITEPSSSSAPSSTPSAKALGKRPALPSPPLSRSLSRASEADRRKSRQALPALRDAMLQELMQSTLSDMTIDLLKMVKQEQAARQYHQAADKRHNAIQTWSQWVYDSLKQQRIDRILAKAVLNELKWRYLARKYLAIWRDWARERRRAQAALRKERARVLTTFQSMGLGSADTLLAEHSVDSAEGGMPEDRDEFLVDVALREAAAERSHLYAPSTFLHIIARHIAPLLSSSIADNRGTPLASPLSTNSRSVPTMHRWETFLSLASGAGSAPPSSASKWLRDKLSVKGEEFYEYSDILFETSVIGSEDDVRAGAVGLIVFEAPLQGPVSSHEKNRKDAQNRLECLAHVCRDQANRYDPALLIITWEDEDLDALSSRLSIASQLVPFSSKTILSLQVVHEVDSRLEMALGAILPSIDLKCQVLIPLQDLVADLLPIWARFADTALRILQHQSTNFSFAVRVFEEGLSIVNQVSKLASDNIGKVEISESATFDPILLPPFDSVAPTSASGAADAIASYLSHEDLSGISEVKLLLGPLSRAVANDATLPVIDILSSLALLVFGEMAGQTLLLESYWPASVAQEVVKGYLSTTTKQYEKYLSLKLDVLGRMLVSPAKNKSTSIRTSEVPLSYESNSENSPIPSVKIGIKRGRLSSSENLKSSPNAKQIKAAKNAKLLQAMAEVNRTLGEMDMDAVY
ncbi:SAC3/GANP/Nin1/mts3/eIF-3 p25 family-domain-containing protein [Kockovaella imperatae]|uniref:SAC3/GANP/Nin1/mts3/eIF-3 p25 family-domain-containing protein n=1 Tax=Kockovaella imperatae TaxID=4999 RepID=A0A1Y1UKU3_9TREE|nr:SAC3/GANP/Nin1/mts3/eIF-3 p25 family-domain-containing protein [Kockovaella imperatae]ORX38670.1 SAC3/GANP/Nin1/mts3/eIF-3 p25 family-domain-containing protein [Kockovaella imperatae]